MSKIEAGLLEKYFKNFKDTEIILKEAAKRGRPPKNKGAPNLSTLENAELQGASDDLYPEEEQPYDGTSDKDDEDYAGDTDDNDPTGDDDSDETPEEEGGADQARQEAGDNEDDGNEDGGGKSEQPRQDAQDATDNASRAAAAKQFSGYLDIIKNHIFLGLYYEGLVDNKVFLLETLKKDLKEELEKVIQEAEEKAKAEAEEKGIKVISPFKDLNSLDAMINFYLDCKVNAKSAKDLFELLYDHVNKKEKSKLEKGYNDVILFKNKTGKTYSELFNLNPKITKNMAELTETMKHISEIERLDEPKIFRDDNGAKSTWYGLGNPEKILSGIKYHKGEYAGQSVLDVASKFINSDSFKKIRASLTSFAFIRNRNDGSSVNIQDIKDAFQDVMSGFSSSVLNKIHKDTLKLDNTERTMSGRLLERMRDAQGRLTSDVAEVRGGEKVPLNHRNVLVPNLPPIATFMFKGTKVNNERTHFNGYQLNQHIINMMRKRIEGSRAIAERQRVISNPSVRFDDAIRYAIRYIGGPMYVTEGGGAVQYKERPFDKRSRVSLLEYKKKVMEIVLKDRAQYLRVSLFNELENILVNKVNVLKGDILSLELKKDDASESEVRDLNTQIKAKKEQLKSPLKELSDKNKEFKAALSSEESIKQFVNKNYKKLIKYFNNSPSFTMLDKYTEDKSKTGLTEEGHSEEFSYKKLIGLYTDIKKIINKIYIEGKFGEGIEIETPSENGTKTQYIEIDGEKLEKEIDELFKEWVGGDIAHWRVHLFKILKKHMFDNGKGISKKAIFDKIPKLEAEFIKELRPIEMEYHEEAPGKAPWGAKNPEGIFTSNGITTKLLPKVLTGVTGEKLDSKIKESLGDNSELQQKYEKVIQEIQRLNGYNSEKIKEEEFKKFVEMIALKIFKLEKYTGKERADRLTKVLVYFDSPTIGESLRRLHNMLDFRLIPDRDEKLKIIQDQIKSGKLKGKALEDAEKDLARLEEAFTEEEAKNIKDHLHNATLNNFQYLSSVLQHHDELNSAFLRVQRQIREGKGAPEIRTRLEEISKKIEGSKSQIEEIRAKVKEKHNTSLEQHKDNLQAEKDDREQSISQVAIQGLGRIDRTNRGNEASVKIKGVLGQKYIKENMSDSYVESGNYAKDLKKFDSVDLTLNINTVIKVLKAIEDQMEIYGSIHGEGAYTGLEKELSKAIDNCFDIKKDSLSEFAIRYIQFAKDNNKMATNLSIENEAAVEDAAITRGISDAKGNKIKRGGFNFIDLEDRRKLFFEIVIPEQAKKLSRLIHSHILEVLGSGSDKSILEDLSEVSQETFKLVSKYIDRKRSLDTHKGGGMEEKIDQIYKSFKVHQISDEGQKELISKMVRNLIQDGFKASTEQELASVSGGGAVKRQKGTKSQEIAEASDKYNNLFKQYLEETQKGEHHIFNDFQFGAANSGDAAVMSSGLDTLGIYRLFLDAEKDPHLRERVLKILSDYDNHEITKLKQKINKDSNALALESAKPDSDPNIIEMLQSEINNDNKRINDLLNVTRYKEQYNTIKDRIDNLIVQRYTNPLREAMKKAEIGQAIADDETKDDITYNLSKYCDIAIQRCVNFKKDIQKIADTIKQFDRGNSTAVGIDEGDLQFGFNTRSANKKLLKKLGRLLLKKLGKY